MKQELKQLADIQSGKILGNLSGVKANIQEISLGTGFTFSSNTLSVDITQGSFTFSNGSGTTYNDNKVDLGGLLTQNVIIEGGSNNLSLGTTGSQLTYLDINAIQGIETYSSGSDDLTITKNPGINSSDFDKESVDGRRSKIDQSLTNINLKVSEDNGLDKSEIIIAYDEINILTRTNGGTASGLSIGEVGGISLSDNINGQGIVYDADYSATFVDESLITKRYVDNAIINTSTFSVDYIDFNTAYTPTQNEGRIHWDQDYGTLDVDLEGNNINLKVGLDNLYYIKNQSGSTINKGSVVRASGTLGSSGRILGDLMIADNTIPHYFTLGIAGENILDGEDGYVYEFGLIRGLDTSGTASGETWVDGDILYVSPTISGGLTKVEPIEPNLKIQMAIVVEADNVNGSIFVRPSLSYNLGDLHNVETAGATGGDLIAYDYINGYWEYTKALNGDYTISGTLSSSGFYGDGSNLTGIDNFGTADLTLTGTRTHDLNGNTLNINNGATNVLTINNSNDVYPRGKGGNNSNFIGLNTGRNSTGTDNTVFGDFAGLALTTGIGTTLIGRSAAPSITNGTYTVSIGRSSLFSATSNATNNTVVGSLALYSLTSSPLLPSNIVAIGYNAGSTLINGNNNTYLGTNTQPLNTASSVNEIIIGYNGVGYGNDTAVLGNSSISLTRLRGRVEMDEITSGPTITDNNSYAIWFNSNVPTIRLKDSGGLETDIPLGGSQTGLISIQDSSGVPTYYSDLQTALNATSDIDTVYIHADIQITSQISIPNRTSLTIEMNGHRIWYSTTSGDFNLFRFATSGGAGTDRIFTLNGGGTLEQVGTVVSTTNAAVIHFFQSGTQRQLQIFAGTTTIKAENAFSIFNQANLRLIDGGIWYSTNGTISLNTAAALIRNANIDIYTSTSQFSGTYDNCHLNTRYGPFWIGGSIVNSRITGAILQTGTNIGMIMCSGNDTISNNVIENGAGAVNWAINCYYAGSSGRISNNTINSTNSGVYLRYGSAFNNYIYAGSSRAITKTSLGNGIAFGNTCITNATNVEAIYTTGGIGIINNYCLCLNASNTASAIRSDGASEQIIGNTAIVNNAAVANINLVGNVYLLKNVLGSTGTGVGGAGTNLQANTEDAYGNIKIG